MSRGGNVSAVRVSETKHDDQVVEEVSRLRARLSSVPPRLVQSDSNHPATARLNQVRRRRDSLVDYCKNLAAHAYECDARQVLDELHQIEARIDALELQETNLLLEYYWQNCQEY